MYRVIAKGVAAYAGWKTIVTLWSIALSVGGSAGVDTPLWRVVMTAQEDLETVRLLLASGTDPRRANASGISPLDVARRSGRGDLTTVLEGR